MAFLGALPIPDRGFRKRFDASQTVAGPSPAPLNSKQPEGGGMQNLISLFSELSEEDAQWIFSTASEHQFFEKAVVIEAGSESTAIYFVLEGWLGVFDPNFTGNPLAIVGPGEFVGEMAFLEKQAAAKTVAAVESSVVLVLPRAELEAKLLSDKGFASRFNPGLAKLLSRRLRRTTARLQAQSLADNVAESGPWKPLQTELTQFKALMKQADDAALSNDGIVPSDLAGVIGKRFQEFLAFINKEIGDAALLSPQMKEEFGSRVQQELLPYLFLTTNGERWYSKPRGYAGDFLTIEQVYGDTPSGFGRLGALLDRCLLDCPPPLAVRNRRGALGRGAFRAPKQRPARASWPGSAVPAEPRRTRLRRRHHVGVAVAGGDRHHRDCHVRPGAGGTGIRVGRRAGSRS